MVFSDSGISSFFQILFFLSLGLLLHKIFGCSHIRKRSFLFNLSSLPHTPPHHRKQRKTPNKQNMQKNKNKPTNTISNKKKMTKPSDRSFHAQLSQRDPAHQRRGGVQTL